METELEVLMWLPVGGDDFFSAAALSYFREQSGPLVSPRPPSVLIQYNHPRDIQLGMGPKEQEMQF